MSDIAISVENLSKAYRIGLHDDRPDTLVESMFSWFKAPVKNFKKLRKLTSFDLEREEQDVIWALKDVSFEVKRGEVVGIIGRNGAGKSTLLKILSRITEPTSGRAVVYGRVGSLLEVGTGFHPELTGRENIYMNGTILGMTKKEIDQKFDEIVEFSGIEKFLDTPVKRYSSGMTVRLAFAVAAHLDPEILIVDEVLAVGDAEFQKKCLGKMESISKAEGKTVLFVSHNMGAVRNLCNKGILLQNGELIFQGSIEKVISEYLETLSDSVHDPFKNNPNRIGDGRVRFVNVQILNHKGVVSNKIIAGKSMSIVFEYIRRDSIQFVEFTTTILNYLGVAIANLTSKIMPEYHIKLSDTGKVICHIKKVPLPPGKYYIGIGIREYDRFCDHIPKALEFEVTYSEFFPQGKLPDLKYSIILMEHTWLCDRYF